MKTALVMGGAACVWDDVERALDLFDPGFIIAVNDIGACWPREVDLWVTLHPEKMNGWRAERARRGFRRAALHVAHDTNDGIDEARDYHWQDMPGSGSSGLFAVKVAMDEGCERVVLAGVPMAPEHGHIADGDVFAKECAEYLKAWQWALPVLRGKVKSMSGWTAEMLGRPDAEWLNG